MDERYPEVDQIAAFILSHPAATAREIADGLQYSQPRSVYYWLRKAGFRGLSPFRHAVLTGSYPVTAYAEGPFMPRADRVAEVPLSRTDPEGDDTTYVVTTWDVSEGAFALTVVSDGYAPLLQRNDVLIVDPRGPVQPGDLVALHEGDANYVFCRMYPGRQPLYVHAADGRPVADPPADAGVRRLAGKIVGLQRRL